MRANEFITEKKKKKKKRHSRNRYFGGYWYPGLGYYGSSDYGSDGGGDGGGGESRTVAEGTTDDINKMFTNIFDPSFAALQRVALLAMQGRQNEAMSQLNRVIANADPNVQKKIIDAVNNIKPVTISGKIADSSTLDKSVQHKEWIQKTFIPWVQSQISKSVAEAVPQPGPSSGAPKQFGSDAKIQTRQMTVKDIISSVPGVPYYNNVIDDWDAKDYSWGVTKKVIEYATYLKKHPESLAQLPPAIILNGKFEDGAHRVSAIWLLQQRMDPKNPLWKNAKLNVQFVKQGVAEEQVNELYEPENSFPLNWYPSFDPSEASARAYDRNRGYIDIKFTPVGISRGMDAVEVEFSRNDSYDMTGGGDANRVLGTVLQAFREYLKGYQPKILIFSAKGESRSKVYQNLIKRFAADMGYKQFDINKLNPNTQAAIRMGAGGDVMVLRKMYQPN